MFRVPHQIQPLKKKLTSLCSLTSLNHDLQNPIAESNEDIPLLFTRFANLSSQIEINHDMSSFNLVEYQHLNNKVKQDEQIAVAKLKRIQNNAELKRANMQLFLRKRKMHQAKAQRSQENPAHQDLSNKTYKNIFETFADGKTSKRLDEDNQSLQQQNEQIDPALTLRSKVNGIIFYNQLVKHPKILNYTLEKIKSREKMTLRQKYQKRDRILKFRNDIKTISRSEPKILTNKQKVCEVPQQIADNIFRRIYTKKHKAASVSMAKTDYRLTDFISKQEDILEHINENSLSKQNYKKLRERFNCIVAEMYESDRKHRGQQKMRNRFYNTIQTYRRNAQNNY